MNSGIKCEHGYPIESSECAICFKKDFGDLMQGKHASTDIKIIIDESMEVPKKSAKKELKKSHP